MDRRKTSESENLRDRKAHKKGLPLPLTLHTHLPGPPPFFPPSSLFLHRFAKKKKKKSRRKDGEHSLPLKTTGNSNFPLDETAT